MSPENGDKLPAKQEQTQSNNGLPPTDVLHRMLDLQEKRFALDSRQQDINERELDNNKALALQSMELNARAHSERMTTMVAITSWRYKFWGVIGLMTAAAVITALTMGKEAFVLEALKYLAVFVGGYGTKAAVSSQKKSQPAETED